MQTLERLQLHLEEAKHHIQRLNSVMETLKNYYPFDEDTFNSLESEILDKLDVLAFRFAKLQDLLGSKIFREYLEVNSYPLEGKSFLEILKVLDKEQIIDIDRWSEFRGVRNTLAHDYPFEEYEKLEAINYLIENIAYLIEVTKKIRRKVETIAQRD